MSLWPVPGKRESQQHPRGSVGDRKPRHTLPEPPSGRGGCAVCGGK